MTQLQLQARNQSLLAEREQLQDSLQKLQRSNRFKWIVLIAALGVSSASLALSIWSTVDNEQTGLNEAGVVLSSVSLSLSVLGVFKDCFTPKESAQQAEEPEVENRNEMAPV